MFKRPHYVAFSLVLMLVVILYNLPDRTATKLKLALGSLFLPLFGLVGSGQSLTGQAADSTIPRRALLAQVEQLRRENEQLRLRLTQADEAQNENSRLRQLLGWQQRSPWKVKAARVIGRDPANWWRTVRIDLGLRDGLRADLPVLSADGLVGRVIEASHSSAQVALVGDPKCRVAVVIRETAENGVVSASSVGVLDHRLVDLTHLPRNTTMKPGQTVYTSGLGGVFPSGILLGTIVDSRSVGYGLYTEARVKLAADSSRLGEVLVILP